MNLILFMLTSFLLLSCNSEIKGTTPPVVEAPLEIKTINILGFKSVKTTVKDGANFVFFEPFIPRDDTAMSYAFLELGEQLFNLKKKPWPQQDIVDVSQGKAIRYKYKSKTLIFMPMKNDDGTIHTVMITEGE